MNCDEKHSFVASLQFAVFVFGDTSNGVRILKEELFSRMLLTLSSPFVADVLLYFEKLYSLQNNSFCALRT